MNKLQEKLDFLLEKYDVNKKVVLSDNNEAVAVNGETYALLPWRNERRFIELKKIVDTTVGNVSHFKIMSLNPETTDLDYVIKRELDTAEYISGLKVTEIFKTKNGNTCSVLCMTDKKALFTLELACTLPENAEVIDKHEIITDRGTACDRNVDSQTPLSSIYVYGANHEEFTDVDFELFGLSIYEISVVRQAFDIAKNPALGEEHNAMSARLDSLVQATKQSAETCENIVL